MAARRAAPEAFQGCPFDKLRRRLYQTMATKSRQGKECGADCQCVALMLPKIHLSEQKKHPNPVEVKKRPTRKENYLATTRKNLPTKSLNAHFHRAGV